MWNEIAQEKKRAQHLFYVSLKYTKTGDVILNLINRWEKVIALCMELLLKKAKKKKKIKEIPVAPKARELAVRSAFKKDKLVHQVMDWYAFFRRIPGLQKSSEHEFRKHIALRVVDSGKEVVMNMDLLKELNELICTLFINQVRHLTSKK